MYSPGAAVAAVEKDADDFVAVVRKRLIELAREREGKPGLVVAAYDTELFGHWWHEGPAWLELILRRLPEAGVRVSTLGAAITNGAVAGSAHPENSSWGSGKDWSVWTGDAVASMVNDNNSLQRRWRKVTSSAQSPAQAVLSRDPALDQLGRAGLLALASDWAFMVTKDSAAGYALDRHREHHADFHRLAGLLEAAYDGDVASRAAGKRLAAEHRAKDGPFGNLDGRLLTQTDRNRAMAPRSETP